MRYCQRPLWRDSRGVTLVEFAIVAPVIFLLLLGMMDLMYRQYVQAVLDGAVQQAGRAASLEGGPNALSEIDAKVVSNVREIAKNLTWASSRKAFSDYSKIGPEPFIDANSNGTRDAKECYSDINDNSIWDADPGKTGVGGAKDSVVYTMTISYPRLFPITSFMGGAVNQELRSTTILKNQPYSSQSVPTPVTRCN